MTKLKVSSEALRASAHELRVCAGQLAIAAEFHSEMGRLGFVEGSILALLEPSHEALAESVQRRLEKSSAILSRTALSLAEAAREYDASNIEAVRLLGREGEA
ncbi:MAG TPA: type VII secretion target [Candidatus Limnocylindrales bacterium]|nr:type VII secretion target [Candidatus Limnocylindrales bacterium]